MNQKMTKKQKYLLLFAIILICFSMMPTVSDDWGIVEKNSMFEELRAALVCWTDYTGRVIGQFLFKYLGSRVILKRLYQAITTFSLIIILSLFDKKSKNRIYFTILLFIGLGVNCFCEVLGWWTCFVYYLPPMLFLSIYLLYLKELFEDDTKVDDSKKKSVICFILGIITNFHLENISVVACFIAITSIIFSYILNRKVYKFQIWFLISTLICALIMFASPVYWDLSLDYRYEDFDWFTSSSLFEKISYNLFYDRMWTASLISDKPILCFSLILLLFSNIRNESKSFKITTILFFVVNVALFSTMMDYKINLCKYNNFVFSFKVARFILVASLLWYILLFIITYIKFNNNKKKFYWMMSLLVYNLVSILPLLFVVKSYYFRCFFPSFIILVIYVLSYKQNCIRTGFTNLYASIVMPFMLLLHAIIIFFNFKVYVENDRLLTKTGKENYDYIIIKSYPFENYVHCAGTISSVFHRYTIQNQYGISINGYIYTDYGKGYVDRVHIDGQYTTLYLTKELENYLYKE